MSLLGSNSRNFVPKMVAVKLLSPPPLSGALCVQGQVHFYSGDLNYKHLNNQLILVQYSDVHYSNAI